MIGASKARLSGGKSKIASKAVMGTNGIFKAGTSGGGGKAHAASRPDSFTCFKRFRLRWNFDCLAVKQISRQGDQADQIR